MRLSAPAKINLHLRVGAPRADGFHPLLSWMCTVGLFDTLVVDRLPGQQVQLTCDAPGVPCDDSNLVVKAAAAMRTTLLAECGKSSAGGELGLSIRLLKRIPAGAGLGGGSSDGACIIETLNSLWNAGWPREKLADLASRLGSDLPFFFHAPSAICRGRGERVQPLSPPQARFALLILPGRPMPTPAVYKQFDRMGLGRNEVIEASPDFNRWTSLDALSLLPMLVNDLETPAFAIDPALGALRSNTEQTLGRIVRMSGSGSSLFTLFDRHEEAEQAAATVRQRFGITAVAVETAPRLPDDRNSVVSKR